MPHPTLAASNGVQHHPVHLVIHGSWYALDSAGQLLTGPISPTGGPDFAQATVVDVDALPRTRAANGLAEVARILRWIRVTSVDADLAP